MREKNSLKGSWLINQNIGFFFLSCTIFSFFAFMAIFLTSIQIKTHMQKMSFTYTQSVFNLMISVSFLFPVSLFIQLFMSGLCKVNKPHSHICFQKVILGLTKYSIVLCSLWLSLSPSHKLLSILSLYILCHFLR